MKTFYADGFAADIGEHTMPMRKFRLVRDRILELGLPAHFEEPPPVTDGQLLRVHTSEYVKAVATGEPRALAESQKFPWSAELAAAVRLTNGAAVSAVSSALEDGAAGALASGYHHAHADHGEGFCTFNGIVVALEDAKASSRIERALVVDLDVHYGNGTASLVSSRPWLHNLSIYGSWYEHNVATSDVTTKRAPDTDNARSIPLPNGLRGADYLATIESALTEALARVRPSVIFYQAGADPYREDPYSPLDLGLEDLATRDALVFAAAKRANIPIAWVLAGGYSKDLSKVVEVHANTQREAANLFTAPR